MPGSPTTSSGGETRPAAGAQAREQPKLTKSGALDNVAGGCASRGVFVAGFAFFELTRGGSLPAGEVAGADAATVYLVLLSAAFALGSIAAACGILVRYFQDACTTKPERTLYAESATWLATMVGTPCLVAALLAYSVALCVVGAAYFPNDDSAYLATAVVMGASAAVSVGAVLWVLVAKATARNAAPNPAAASGEVRFEPLHVCRMRQAAVFADRATFVVGFAQAGVVRYNARTPENEGLAVAFLVAATLACGAALASSLLGTALVSATAQLQTARAREQFARRTGLLWSAVSMLFFVSLAAMIVGLAFAGWGANFEAQALLLAWMGFVGAAAMVGGFLYVSRKYKAALTATGAGKTPDSATDDWIHHFTLQLRVVGGTGNQAVVAGGFTFMTVVAFQDTVMGRFGATQPWANLFLLANALAAVLALLSTLFATQLQVWLDALPTVRQKAYFARSGRPLALFCGWSLECALVSFLAGFAVYGTARFTPTRYAPVVMGALGVLAMFIVFMVVHRAFSEAENTSRTGPAGADGNRERFVYPGLASRLDSLGGGGLVLGAFMYLTLHDTVDIAESEGGAVVAYNTAVAVAAIISVAAAAWATMTVVRLKSLRADRQKELYASTVQPVATLVYVVFLLGLLAALAGPPMMSLTPAYDSRSATGACMAAPAAVFLLVAVVAMCRAVSVARGAQRDVENGGTPPVGMKMPHHQRMLDTASPLGMQAAFIAGFCLIEIGDVGLLRGDTWSHAAYLGLIACTSSAAICTLSCVAQLCVWVPHPEDDWARDRVAVQLRTGSVSLVAWVFHGVWLALVCWQGGVVVLGIAKWGDSSRSNRPYLAPVVAGGVAVLASVAVAIAARLARRRDAGPPRARVPSDGSTVTTPKASVVAMNPLGRQEVEMKATRKSSPKPASPASVSSIKV